MKNIIFTVALTIGLALANSTTVWGHEIFQDVMKEKYTLKSFSCKTCHPDNDDRKIRSQFAELIYQEMKEKNYSAKFTDAEKAGEDAIKEFDKLVAKDFEKAMVVVGEKQMTFDALIRAGMFNGARLDTKKIAAQAAAKRGLPLRPTDLMATPPRGGMARGQRRAFVAAGGRSSTGEPAPRAPPKRKHCCHMGYNWLIYMGPWLSRKRHLRCHITSGRWCSLPEGERWARCGRRATPPARRRR